MLHLVLVILLILGGCAQPQKAKAATTYSMSPGDDWGTKLAQLNPGDTLQLTDGTYSTVTFYCSSAGNLTSVKQGLSGSPITIAALNERKAKVHSNGTQTAFGMYDCSYWNIVGLMFDSDDSVQSDDAKGTLMILQGVNVDSHHIQLRHNLFVHPNRSALGAGNNDMAYGVLLQGRNNNYLIEENEWYDDPGPRALMFSTYAGSQYDHIVRRNYFRNRTTTGTYGTDPTINCYFCDGTVIIENNIGENAIFNGYGGANVKYLGNISNNVIGTAINPHLPGSVNNKHHADPQYTNVMSMTATNNLGINVLYGAQASSVSNVNITHHTSIGHVLLPNGDGVNDGYVDNLYDSRKGGSNCYVDPNNVPCVTQYHMTVVYKDSLILNGAGVGIAFGDVSLYDGTPGGLTLTNMNVYGNAQGNYGANTGGAGGTKFSQDPTMGTCRAWIPAGSFNKGKASDGGDIGATILYAYENGLQTTKPLWKPDGSWIGCGAIIAGVNDNPATSCSGVGARLNINQNGCPFPAGYASVTTSPRAHYPLDEGSGTVAGDTSGNQNNLTIPSPSWVPGYTGTALAFTGTAGGATRNAFTSAFFSWSMWVRSPNAPAQANPGTEPISNGDDASEVWGFGWDNPGAIGAFRQACFVLGSDNGSYAAKIPTALLGNTWYWIGSTFDGTTLKCFLNGQAVIATNLPSGVGLASASGQFHLGAAKTVGFNGTIDDVYVDDRALSETEMFTRYQQGVQTFAHRRAILAGQ